MESRTATIMTIIMRVSVILIVLTLVGVIVFGILDKCRDVLFPEDSLRRESYLTTEPGAMPLFSIENVVIYSLSPNIEGRLRAYHYLIDKLFRQDQRLASNLRSWPNHQRLIFMSGVGETEIPWKVSVKNSIVYADGQIFCGGFPAVLPARGQHPVNALFVTLHPLVDRDPLKINALEKNKGALLGDPGVMQFPCEHGYEYRGDNIKDGNHDSAYIHIKNILLQISKILLQVLCIVTVIFGLICIAPMLREMWRGF